MLFAVSATRTAVSRSRASARVCVCLVVLALLGIGAAAGQVHAATRTWDGGQTTGSAATQAAFSSAGHWSDDTTPVDGDTALFSGAGGGNAQKNCTFDVDRKLAAITINGYTGTISQSGTRRITVTGDFSQATGTFNAPAVLWVGGNFGVSAGTFTAGTGVVILA